MRNPGELRAFVLADELVIEVYRHSADFPADERFGLTSQVRRAAVSIASNLVEGCSRDGQADFRRFVEIALGSAMELRYQLSVARRLWSGPLGDVTSSIEDRAGMLVRVLTGLAKSLRAETSNPKPETGV